jgi:hypothetical protein
MRSLCDCRDSTVLITDECVVCSECAVVLGSVDERDSLANRFTDAGVPLLQAIYQYDLPSKKNVYQTVYHIHERIKMWCMYDTKISDSDFETISEYACKMPEYPPYERWDCDHVRRILRLVDKEFLKPRHHKPYFAVKYAEKWKSIIRRLSGKVYPQRPPDELAHLVNHYFERTIKPYFAEHIYLFPQSKVNGIARPRHNFYNIDCGFVAILNILHHVRPDLEPLKYVNDFRLLSNRKKIEDTNRVLQAICYNLAKQFPEECWDKFKPIV